MMSNPLAGVGSSAMEAEKGQAALAQARAVGAKTQRERDHVEAVGAYYQDFATRPERARQATQSAAYEALAARYPDDDEAQIFNALYIACTQSQADQTYAAYDRAVAILTEKLTQYPDHPGIAHYLIHSFDAAPIAAKGMPAALAFAAALPGREYSEAQHASDYMVYADLQLARDKAANAALQAAFSVTVPPPMPPATFYARAAMPARLLVERGNWQRAAKLPTLPPGQPYGAAALPLFARAIGAARSGDAAQASRDVEELRAVQKALTDGGNTYWATEVGIQATAASAWAALAHAERDTARAAMRDAADREDRQNKHIVTPGRILPARELLADMLMELGQPAAALAVYEASFLRDPNRFRGIYGAARAADAAGDQSRATLYAHKLMEQAKDADTERPELAWARRRP